MRRWLFALVLAGCGHGKATAPAWPAPSTTADDGGESIAPHEVKVAAAIEKVDTTDAKPLTPAVTVPTAAKPGETAPATAPAATPPQVEDIFISEDLIIEIDD